MSFLGGGGGGSAPSGATQAQANEQYGNVQQTQAQQQALIAALQAQGGIQNQSNVFQQQQQLANQLQQQTLGQGPNPAQAQLAQNTGANVQQQAALQAGQRGASANSGLAARSAGIQGAGIQQQATGQAATMQANQQLAAQQQLQQQQASMAGLAGQQVGQQQGAVQNAGANALQGQSNALNSIAGQQQLQAQREQTQGNVFGGLLQAGGAIAGSMFGGPAGAAAGSAVGSAGGGALGRGLAQVAEPFAHGGQVKEPRMSAATEASRLDTGYGKVILKSNGGPIPGKANVPGDSKKNDTVHAMLSPGEIVIPRSVVIRGPDAVRAFAAHIMEQESGE